MNQVSSEGESLVSLMVRGKLSGRWDVEGLSQV